VIHICTLLWTPNGNEFGFSRCYNESWVEKLYRGAARNLKQPFRFVCFTDFEREFSEPIEQELLKDQRPSYGTCIEPYRLGRPMILMGLDTVIVASIDHLADYCLKENTIALPRDPYGKTFACNGVALVPGGKQDVFEKWRGENDMKWMRAQKHVYIDDMFPGQVVSYKGHVKKDGLGDARIVYFHGKEKPHEIDEPFVRAHWV
jgi:hypothetical protein